MLTIYSHFVERKALGWARDRRQYSEGDAYDLARRETQFFWRRRRPPSLSVLNDGAWTLWDAKPWWHSFVLNKEVLRKDRTYLRCKSLISIFLQYFHWKSSALLSSAAIFFIFCILKAGHIARPLPPTPAVTLVITQRAWANAPEDRKGKQTGPSRFVQSGDGSSWCQEYFAHDKDASDSLFLHVSAPRV